MVLYNITLNIDNDITEACLDYLKRFYVPQPISMFNVKNVDTLNYWIEHEGQHISKRLVERFGDKVAGFTTVLEEIDLSE